MPYLVTCYTCVTGDYDKIEKIINGYTIKDPSVRYVIYTDTAHSSREQRGNWEIRPLECADVSCPRRTARWHKVNAHSILPDTKYSIWFDGSQVFKDKVDPRDMLFEDKHYSDMATFRHPQRTCVYQELKACVRLGKDDPVIMQKQIEGYKQEGYPTYNGLVETACVVRRHTPSISLFNRTWWREIAFGSVRDQLSFNYAVWNQQINYMILPGSRDDSDYFNFHPHKRK